MRQLILVPSVWLILFALSADGNCQSAQDLAKVAQSGICPAQLATYELINANDNCNPGGQKIKACDSRFKPGTRSWSECYDDVLICRKQVDESNSKIIQYNSLIYKCRNEQRQKEAKKKMAAAEAARLAKRDKQGREQPISSALSKALDEQRRKADKATKKSEIEKDGMSDIANERAMKNRAEKDRIDAADLSGWKRYQDDLERQREEQRKKYMEDLRRWREAQRLQAERNMAILQQQR